MECIPPFPHLMPPGLPTATVWPAGESTCPNQPCSPASHHFPPVLELHPPTLGKCPGSYVLWSTAGSRPSRLHFPLLPSLSLQHHTPLPGVSPQGALVGLAVRLPSGGPSAAREAPPLPQADLTRRLEEGKAEEGGGENYVSHPER